jgi:5-methylcytosine-specific restriction endonuclease McrA
MQTRDERNITRRKLYVNQRLERKIQQSLASHKRKGFNIDVSFEYLEQLFKITTNCPLCGCKLILTNPKICGNLATIDRKDNEHTLTSDNVWVICNHCNQAKGNKTLKEFIEYCKVIYDTHKGMIT